MPEFIMLCGVPTSGKSTYASKQEGYVVISSDRHIEEYAKVQGKSYNEVFDDFIEEALFLVDKELENALNNNENIILDQTNLNKKSRYKKLHKVQDNYKKTAVYFEVSKDEMLKRNHTEDRGKVVPQRVLLQMYEAFKVPSYDEGFDEIINGTL